MATRYSAKFGGFVSIHQKIFRETNQVYRSVCEECANLCSRRGEEREMQFHFSVYIFFLLLSRFLNDFAISENSLLKINHP